MMETSINKVSLQVFHCFSVEIQFQIFFDIKICSNYTFWILLYIQMQKESTHVCIQNLQWR